jgi:flagellar biosynthesis protein FlhF
MQLHTFTARSLADALRIVRQELGPDASVLHTREVGSTVSRWFGLRTIEVTASAELQAPSRLAMSSEESVPRAELHDFRGQIRNGLTLAAEAEPSLIEQLATNRNAPQTTHFHGSDVIRRRLLRAGITQRTIDRWLSQLGAELACDPQSHPDRIHDRLRHIVAAELIIHGPIRLRTSPPTVIALAGPTGVGKTTTLAKLAAHFRLAHQRSVGLITLDTFRIGATDQLRAYGQIMDLPTETAASSRDMQAALARLKGHDLILIDTGGTSPHDHARLDVLRGNLLVARPDEVHLVLSAVTDAATFCDATDAFAAIGATNLILTKVDETSALGRLADCLIDCQLPLSYITTGQNVPRDLEPAAALRLVEILLNPEL